MMVDLAFILFLATVAGALALPIAVIVLLFLRRWAVAGRVLLLGLLLLFASNKMSCALWWWGATEEMGRFRSPDGRYDAVVTRFNPGAMDDYTWYVHVLRPRGRAPVMGQHDVFSATHLNWLKARWLDASTLEIRYQSHREPYAKKGKTPPGIKLRVVQEEPPSGNQ